MAIVKFAKCQKTQTVGGLHGAITYCCRPTKVAYQGRSLISGVNCVPQAALLEFMNTKRQYGSTDGRMYYHMVQSFRPDDPVTPEIAHEIALKLAEQIPGYEIIVATHTDREHLHSHFVINSVSYDTGLKYHSNRESLEMLWKASDKLCMQYGLSVVKPKKQKQKKERTISDREYRAYAKGKSWKMDLEITVDECMAQARSREHFILDRYLMYLRKSRMDTDYDEVSVEETLSRHRQILDRFCKDKKLNVVEVLEEVVSGESLAARPQMMRLLDLVSTGMYAGVVCMDIERLSRGSSMEAGYIMHIFQTNYCKIITPGKVFDLQNESDEQFTDMKFMFSRYELKTINKRLVRGRNQSASEGKFMGSMAPYGYRPYKLAGQKGNSLRIEPEEAKVVQMIFDMYGKQGMGYNAIAYVLNDMHIPARKGKWSQTSIVNILTNEVYLGKIRWRREPVKKVVKDGFLTKKRIQNDDYDLYDGLHEPIITEEQWSQVKAVQAKYSHASVHTQREVKNPFAGILFCEKCGAALKRNVPGKNQGTAPWFRCPTRGCDCRIVKCHTVEETIRGAMEDWLDEYIIQLNSDSKPKIDPIATALEAVQAQLASLQQQQDALCDYLEKGVYTIGMFTKRNATLAREIKKLQESEAELMRKKESSSQANQAAMEIIPTTQHILDNYDVLTIAEKNRLWKLVLKKATVYRTPEGELSVHIYPEVPR